MANNHPAILPSHHSVSPGRSNFRNLPLEVRDRIYDYVRDDIFSRRSNHWFKKPVTDYDGLKSTCSQIHHETDERLFQFNVSHSRAERLSRLPSSKLVLSQTRSLSVEIKFEQLPQFHVGFASTLDTIQLSLQELRLSFTGNDKHGKEVKVHGCGKLEHDHRTFPKGALSISGQYIHEQLHILRQLTILRNLRVLVVNNTNLPIFQNIILSNKPYLTAVQLTSDPRTILHKYETISSNPRLLRGLLPDSVNRFPPVKVLSISANAAMSSCSLAVKVMPTLKHLTYTVPDYDMVRSTYQCSPLSDAARIVSSIFGRAPYLKTLRLCVAGRTHESTTGVGSLIGALKNDLSRLRIENLEIHIWNESPYLGREVFSKLSSALKRLYSSSRTCSVDDLIHQVNQQFLFCGRLEERSFLIDPDRRRATRRSMSLKTCMPVPLSTSTNVSTESIRIKFGNHGLVSYQLPQESTNTAIDQSGQLYCSRRLKCKKFGENPGIIGEIQHRSDSFPLGGNLGFVGFEFDASDSDSTVVKTATQTKLLRLNGILLDREHTKQPFVTEMQQRLARNGILPKVIAVTEKPPSETASRSDHVNIACGLHSMNELIPKLDRTREILSNLRGCGLDDEHWYFGSEDEAEEVFNKEPVAKAKDLQLRSYPAIVEVEPTHKCQWMAPEYEVPPVGSFPPPPMSNPEKPRG